MITKNNIKALIGLQNSLVQLHLKKIYNNREWNSEPRNFYFYFYFFKPGTQYKHNMITNKSEKTENNIGGRASFNQSL